MIKQFYLNHRWDPERHLGVVAKKGYSTFLKAAGLEPYCQIV